jgi:hypothetical protein
MQTILLTASINKLSMTRDEAEDYAALIMESVDNKNKGYIKVPLYIILSKYSTMNLAASTLEFTKCY